jgi:hypothetical protein
LHTDKTCVGPSTLGSKFLGLVLQREGRRLQHSAIKKFNPRRRRFRHDEAKENLDFARMTRSLHAWLAQASGTNSTGIRRAWPCWLSERRERQPEIGQLQQRAKALARSSVVSRKWNVSCR